MQAVDERLGMRRIWCVGEDEKGTGVVSAIDKSVYMLCARREGIMCFLRDHANLGRRGFASWVATGL